MVAAVHGASSRKAERHGPGAQGKGRATKAAKLAPSCRAFEHHFARRGHSWRVQSDERGNFDEIVVIIGKPPKAGNRRNEVVIHAEMMDARSCFVDVAGLCLWVHVGRDGVARITYQEDRREPAPKLAQRRGKR